MNVFIGFDWKPIIERRPKMEGSAKIDPSTFFLGQIKGEMSENNMQRVGMLGATLAEHRQRYNELKLKGEVERKAGYILGFPAAEYRKLYHEANKEKIAEKKSEKIRQRVTCECGAEIALGTLQTHRLRPKHIHAMRELEKSASSGESSTNSTPPATP